MEACTPAPHPRTRQKQLSDGRLESQCWRPRGAPPTLATRIPRPEQLSRPSSHLAAVSGEDTPFAAPSPDVTSALLSPVSGASPAASQSSSPAHSTLSRPHHCLLHLQHAVLVSENRREPELSTLGSAFTSPPSPRPSPSADGASLHCEDTGRHAPALQMIDPPRLAGQPCYLLRR